MGTFASSPAQFVAGTKAKSAEINAKFTDHYNALRGGTYDLYINGLHNNRTSNGDVDVTGGSCYFNGYFAVDSNVTYKLKTSTSRMVTFGELIVYGTVDITSGAELLVI